MKAKLYKTYLFRDKDPVIDSLRDVVKKNGGYGKVSTASGVSHGTLANWFDGPTRRPQFATVAAVARSMGNEGVAAIVRTVKKNGA